jgi:HSP20 family molecular chaperone IbpA
MAQLKIDLKKTDSINDELTRVHDEISCRAYDLSLAHDGVGGQELDDWCRAERELISRPAVELRRTEGQIELDAAVAGFNPKDLDVRVSAQDILITGNSRQHRDVYEGTVCLSELNVGKLFRSVHLPEPIDPDSAHAEYADGLLHVTASLAKPEVKSVDAQC